MLTPDNQPALPSSGRLAGIDFGTVRVGVAISDFSQQWSSPLETWQRKNETQDAEHVRTLVATEQIVGWVVGLPLHTSGQASEKSEEAVAFGNWLSEVTELPVNWIDERFSTAMAREILSQSQVSGAKKKAALDRIAAQVILKTWLDTPRHGTGNKGDMSLGDESD